MKFLVFAALLLAVVGLQNSSKPATVTYYKNIAPIIASKCLPCHSKDINVAPFDFSTYESVTSRVELIRTQILSKSMPPMWAKSDYGNFSRIHSVTDDEAVLFQQWVQQKMPAGKFEVHERPFWHVPPRLITELKLGKGKMVKPEGLPYWSVSSVDMPAKGGHFEGFTLIPDNPRVVRSATLAIVPKSMTVPTETNGSMDLPSQYLVGVWAPGYNEWNLRGSLWRKYPPYSKLVVQVQYRPSGRTEKGGIEVDLLDSTLKKGIEPTWATMENKEFVIPAGKSDSIEINSAITKNQTLISIVPEARYYASRVELTYTSKIGKPKTLFNTMRWDPNWVGNYMFTEPVLLAKGGTLTAKFFYNNDEYCQVNEGKKPKPVKAGPGVSDEICRMHLLFEP